MPRLIVVQTTRAVADPDAVLMGDTSSVPATEPYDACISSGPRWDALVDALDVAKQSLQAPLTPEELRRGWDEPMRLAILKSVGEIKHDITETPCVRPGHYKSWIRSEMIDPKVEDARWLFALGPDDAVRNIETAQDLLNAALALIMDLPSLLPSEPQTTDQMIAVLRETTEGLARGDYVTLNQFRAWDEILARCGVRRRVLTGISYVTAERKRLGVNMDFIEERPAGGAWDRIDIYDHLLVNHGGMDINNHFSDD